MGPFTQPTIKRNTDLCLLTRLWASLVAQLVKKPTPMWETWVRSLGAEDALEEERLPLQYSGLENSMASLWGPWSRKESDVIKQLYI